jgi:uncharacterized protein (TIGR04255 family)
MISPYYSMSNAVPNLQDKLRKVYPRTVEAQEIVIDANKPTAQPIWQLLSANQDYGVQFGTRTISLHATSYLHFSDFLIRWAEVLDAIGAENLNAFVERAGLRFVDLIVPSGDLAPCEYLDESLRGITPEGAISTGFMCASAFQFDHSVVNLRTAAPSPKGLLLPPDFNPLPLKKPKIMEEAEKRINNNKSIGFIDTDCLKEIQCVFDAGELTGAFTEMQNQTSRTFKSALSSVAKGEWM